MGLGDWWDTISGYAGDPFDTLGHRDAAQAAKEQFAAQQAARDQNLGLVASGKEDISGLAAAAEQAIREGTWAAGGALTSGHASQLAEFGKGIDALGQGRTAAIGALGAGLQQARSDLAPVTALQRFAGDATTAVQTGRINPYDVTGAGGQINPYDVTGQRSLLEGRMGQGDALLAQAAMGTNLEMDPGYQFRQQQGEQAIMRSRAAQGGRLSGAALKELAQFNSGLASQEYAAADQRRLAQNSQLQSIIGQQYGASGNVDALRQTALLNQAGRTDTAAQQAIQNRIALAMDQASRSDAAALEYERNKLAAGLEAQRNKTRFAEMGFGAQGELSRLASRHGESVAGLETQFAGGLAGLHGKMGDAAMSFGAGMAGLQQEQGTGLAGIRMNAAGQLVGLNGAAMGVNTNFAQYPGMVAQGQANAKQQTVGAAGSILGAIFSDERVKTDVHDGAEQAEELLQTLRPFVYRYASEAYGAPGRHLGVMAQDLERSSIGRELVIDTPAGKMVDAQRAVAALLGIVSHLHAEIEALKREVRAA